ncbi:hypothetical protein L6452_20334 [Arctium lappa]|uniref:Uncharacterized protein n=1 Tax=Arctium lappa TaxID=4217 RepID=A0ACB9BB40_ARCLA|nr:hypothetical protein L6452_20334 [Arctium lappa]
MGRLHNYKHHGGKVKYYCKWCRRGFMICNKMFEHQSACVRRLTNQQIEEKVVAEKELRLKAIRERRAKKKKGAGCCSATPPTPPPPPPPTEDALEV